MRQILARFAGRLDDDEALLVTSDRDLAAKARVVGAAVVASRPFRGELGSFWSEDRVTSAHPAVDWP